MSARSRGPGRWTLVRDIMSFTLGWALIFQQALFIDPGKVNSAFLWLAAALLGVPGASEVVARFRAGTGGAASSRRPPDSRSSSSGSRSGGDR